MEVMLDPFSPFEGNDGQHLKLPHWTEGPTHSCFRLPSVCAPEGWRNLLESIPCPKKTVRQHMPCFQAQPKTGCPKKCTHHLTAHYSFTVVFVFVSGANNDKYIINFWRKKMCNEVRLEWIKHLSAKTTLDPPTRSAYNSGMLGYRRKVSGWP